MTSIVNSSQHNYDDFIVLPRWVGAFGKWAQTTEGCLTANFGFLIQILMFIKRRITARSIMYPDNILCWLLVLTSHLRSPPFTALHPLAALPSLANQMFNHTRKSLTQICMIRVDIRCQCFARSTCATHLLFTGGPTRSTWDTGFLLDGM